MNTSALPDMSFTVIYRWRLHAGMEDSFIHAWAEVTHAIREQCGGLGSRLHRGDDGLWIAYAQWPNRNAWEQAELKDPAIQSVRQAMRAAVAEEFPDIPMQPIADLLVPASVPSD